MVPPGTSTDADAVASVERIAANDVDTSTHAPLHVHQKV